MLLLKLVAMLFPTTDRKHPVTEPAALLLGSYLSNCGLSRPQHVATGGAAHRTMSVQLLLLPWGLEPQRC